jgi:hypothetical protein
LLDQLAQQRSACEVKDAVIEQQRAEVNRLIGRNEYSKELDFPLFVQLAKLKARNADLVSAEVVPNPGCVVHLASESVASSRRKMRRTSVGDCQS